MKNSKLSSHTQRICLTLLIETITKEKKDVLSRPILWCNLFGKQEDKPEFVFCFFLRRMQRSTCLSLQSNCFASPIMICFRSRKMSFEFFFKTSSINGMETSRFLFSLRPWLRPIGMKINLKTYQCRNLKFTI